MIDDFTVRNCVIEAINTYADEDEPIMPDQLKDILTKAITDYLNSADFDQFIQSKL